MGTATLTVEYDKSAGTYMITDADVEGYLDNVEGIVSY